MQQKRQLAIIKRKSYMICTKMNIILYTILPTLFVPKRASANEYEFLGKKGNGIFSPVQKIVEEAGASFYSLAKSGAIIWLMIALIFLFVGLGSSNSTKVQASKDRSGWIIIAGVGIFGIMGIIGLISNLGASFVTNVKIE